MVQVNINDEIDLKEIFGRKKGKSKEFFETTWKRTYPIFNNIHVITWIKTKIWKYKSGGKDPKNFNVASYLRSLQEYALFYEMSIDELLEDELSQRNTKLLNYLNTLINQGKNPVSVKNAYQSRIKSFFSNQGKPITEGLETESAGLNKDEIILNKDLIKKIYHKFESPDYRVINKFQTCLGLRIEDILTELISGKYTIEQYQDYSYIRNFMTQKELVRINFLFFPQELSTLIKAAYNTNDLTQLDLTTLFTTSQGGKVKKADYLKRLKQITETLGIKGNSKTHAYRKYFESCLNEVNALNKYEEVALVHLMGRTLDKKTDKSYLQKLNDIQFLFEFFKKVEPKISIETEFIDNHKTMKHAINTLKESLTTIVGALAPEDISEETIEGQTEDPEDSKLAQALSKVKDLLEKIDL